MFFYFFEGDNPPSRRQKPRQRRREAKRPGLRRGVLNCEKKVIEAEGEADLVHFVDEKRPVA